MSYRKMTKPERKKHIRRKYRTGKEKLYILAFFIFLLVILSFALFHTIRYAYHPIVPIMIFVGIAITGMFGLLFIDMFFWESE